MKLIHTHLHNFRSIIDQQFSLSPYGLIVGANNAGKSSIIDAIRAFYEADGFKFDKDRDFPYIPTEDQESWIELTFKLDKEEFESLANDYKNDNQILRVRKFFLTNSKTHDEKSATGLIFSYKPDGTLSNEPFYGAKNVQSGKFGELIYIPAISRVDDHAKLSGPSALRDLLIDIMSDVVEDGSAYKKLSESVGEFANAIRSEKTTDNRSLAGFEDELNSLLRTWSTKFHLNILPPTPNDIVKSMLQWNLIDETHGRPQGASNFGSGFQRHFIYSLIQLGTRYIGKKQPKKKKTSAPP